MPDDAIKIHIAVSNAAFAHVPVSRDTHPPISSWCVYSVHKFFLPLSAESRLRRPVEASNAYTLTITGFVGDTYTSDNQTADGTTWWRPSSPPISAEIRPRRLVRADNTPVRTGFTRDAYTLSDETVNGRTWRRPSFSCRYRQKASFVGPWESATRRIEPAKPARRTRWLMKQSTAQHGGIRISLPISTESRTHRSVGDGNTSVRAGFAGSTYTPAIKMADRAKKLDYYYYRSFTQFLHRMLSYRHIQYGGT